MILIVNILAGSIDIGHCLHHLVVCTRYNCKCSSTRCSVGGSSVELHCEVHTSYKNLVEQETVFYVFGYMTVNFFSSSLHLYPLIMGKSFSFAALFPYSWFLLITMISNLNLTCMMLWTAEGRYKKTSQSRSSNGITLDTGSAVDLFHRRLVKKVSVPLIAF